MRIPFRGSAAAHRAKRQSVQIKPKTPQFQTWSHRFTTFLNQYHPITNYKICHTFIYPKWDGSMGGRSKVLVWV